VAEQTAQRAQARLLFCVARAAKGGEAYTVCYMPFVHLQLCLLQ